MGVPESGDSRIGLWDETGTVRIAGAPGSPWVIELEPDFKLNHEADAMAMRVQRMVNELLMAEVVSEAKAAMRNTPDPLAGPLDTNAHVSSVPTRLERLRNTVLVAQATVREMQSHAPDPRVFEGGRPTACYAQVRSGLVTLVAVEPGFFARESAATVGADLTAAIHEALSQTREASQDGEPPFTIRVPGGPR